MKRRFTINDQGLLEDRDGVVIGKVVGITIDIPDVRPEPVGATGTEGDDGGTIGGQTSLLELVPKLGEGSGGVGEKGEPDVERVWAHYIAVMQPRRTELDPGARKVIREALKVASADECCEAISGCANSRFHMGDNDRSRKYNSISQILKGRRGQETTRERIDYFINMNSGQSKHSIDPSVSSVARDRIQRRRVVVVEMYSNRHSPGAQERGVQALAWLREHAKEEPVVEDGKITGWQKVEA